MLKLIKISFLSCFFSAISLWGWGQDLVQNGSFEGYSSCPNGGSQINYSIGWFPFSGTPDYFHSCSAPGFVSVPSNIAGIRYAADGDAYCLLQSYVEGDSIYSNYEREIVGRQLSTPMVIGQKYYVSFKVNLILKSDLGANLATNKLGALFSTVFYSNLDSSTIPPVNNFAHIYSDSVINDTLNWTMISGSFIADSAYHYISIGNFFKYQNMTLIAPISTPFIPTACYFIDDVRVSSDSSFVLSVNPISSNNQTSFSIYPNPTNDFVNITFEDNKPHTVVIYNSVGETVLTNFVNKQSSINISALSQGVYYIQTNIHNRFINKKLIIY